MKLFYGDTYYVPNRINTTTKAKWIYESLLLNPIHGVEVVSPPTLDESLLRRVHCQKYIEAVRSGFPRKEAESQGFNWSPDLWNSVVSSNMGVVAAARSSLSDGVAGSLSSGLHHARYSHGAGFCTFNGLVMAAESLHHAGTENVLILDLDAHFGGGTNTLTAGLKYIHHVDISVNRFDIYPINRVSISLGSFRITSWLTDASVYLQTIEASLKKATDSGITFGACLYNAGVDPHEDCPAGGIGGVTTDMLYRRDQFVFDWCGKQGIPVTFVLAGGYIGPDMTQEKLVGLHCGTIEAAVSAFA